MNSSIRTKIYTTLTCTICMAALGTALSTCVEAANLPDVPSKTVRFSDLDISKLEGAKVLYSRIRGAARDVCERSTGTDPIMRLAFKSCFEKAVDRAVQAVNAPLLTSLRSGNTDIRLASK